MKQRRGRQLLGASAGVLWGAGAAVLIQQFGLWPLDVALSYGLPLAAALLSGWWARRGSRRPGKAAVIAAVVLVPMLAHALQAGSCDVRIGERLLGATSIGSPIELDPDNQPVVVVQLVADALEGETGTLWAEVAGVRIDIVTGPIDILSREVNIAENGFFDLTGAPGLYHLGGDIEGGCSVDGYVKVLGNPLENPLGAAAAGAVIVGLLGTLAAGRRPRVPTLRSGSKLRRDGRPVVAGRAMLRTPGLDGTVEIHEPTSPTSHEALGFTTEACAAFDDQHLEIRHALEFTETAEWPHPALDAAIPTRLGEPGFSIELPDPGPGYAQVVLATDEGGVTTWNYAVAPDGGLDTLPGRPTREYRIVRRVASDAAPPQTRTAFGSLGSKLMTALAFPLLDPVLGHVGELFAKGWEARHRPYRLRSFTPLDFDSAEAAEPDWDALTRGRCLLLVHGTFSTTHAAFAGLSPQFVSDLSEMYGDRVFAFDHPTLGDDPKQNAEWLLGRLPAGLQLDADIICHSRGGLVSRVLAERQPDLNGANGTLNVGKVVFVGSPNAGTILAEPAYVSDLIDSYTNLVNFVPGPFVADVLGAMITAVKQIAVGAVTGLAGLQSMRPAGPFLRWLNATSAGRPRYHAVAGDYEPLARGWRQYATNRLMDRIFREPNDLVVPFEGTFSANGSDLFPIGRRHDLIGPDGIAHSGYFASKEVRDQLLDWLRS